MVNSPFARAGHGVSNRVRIFSRLRKKSPPVVEDTNSGFRGHMSREAGRCPGPTTQLKGPLTPFLHDFIAICHSLLICLLVRQLLPPPTPHHERLLEGKGHSMSLVHGYYYYVHFAERQDEATMWVKKRWVPRCPLCGQGLEGSQEG